MKEEIVKTICHSCDFDRKCTEYKGVFLCTRCKKEAIEDTKEPITGSVTPQSPSQEEKEGERYVKDLLEGKSQYAHHPEYNPNPLITPSEGSGMEWEEEFDRLFTKQGLPSGIALHETSHGQDITPSHIKDFIRQLLAFNTKEVLEDLLDLYQKLPLELGMPRELIAVNMHIYHYAKKHGINLDNK